MSDEEVIAALVPVHGIGRWTAQMFLIFALCRLDVLPVDDFGLRNAVRHAGAAGTVTVRVSCADGRAEVRVRDGGRGVPAADREAIFLPGVRGSAPEGEGSGLGLAIAREIAEEHDGTLTLDPAGPGACFRLRLPLAAPSADDPRAA